jgi:hypothetical protein
VTDLGVRLRRWTRVEYERLVESGFFRPGDRVELIAGHLIVAEPQNSPHATAYRDPRPDPRARCGWAYRGMEHHGRAAAISPLAMPGARVAVADLLP